MPCGEKVVIYVKSQYYSESTLMPVVEGVDEVILRWNLSILFRLMLFTIPRVVLSIAGDILVRDVLGDGRLIKRRIHDGRGEFPMDCPLQDSLLSVHYQGFLLNEEKMVFYDKSERGLGWFHFPRNNGRCREDQRGNRLFKEGKFELAKAKYEKVLCEFNHVHPQDDEEGKELQTPGVAACLLKLGEHKKSIEARNKVLDANLVHVKALYRCGMAYMASGDFEEARADFNKMMSIDKSYEGSAKAAPLKLKKEEQSRGRFVNNLRDCLTKDLVRSQKPGLMTGDEATSENLEKDDLDNLDDHEERTCQTTAPPPPPVVGEHVGTKSKEACVDRILNSPYFPLPEDMGKNRKELLAMAKGNFTEKKDE
ncbi:hypothetical protein P3S67_026842 [Capsicum chacoense]